MPVDYSRFDHIGDSDSEDEVPQANMRQGGPVARGRSPPNSPGRDDDDDDRPQPPPRPPPDIMDDLEDYFERLDRYRQQVAEGRAGDGARSRTPSVERFDDDDLAGLSRRTATAEQAGEECAICLLAIEAQDELLMLPCAARHAFHGDCVRNWLARGVTCPLCRVDVRRLVRATSPRTSPRDAGVHPPRPDAAGYTRDGGVIVRYEPRPSVEVQRPDYIPEELRSQAELVEIAYPDMGTARVWRVPRMSDH
eukprot:gnl/TRDRNA2_/TRDRNA2_194726_c0_seq1.p1 gnl/TRDRNA2_/TRDRNA2_194726_c0~~gnl/TRDRNA2_/TRDRNA2_194726_c0_seq1.p1  ORF type:complete len:251 (-),score=31.73 gnl/TRDRNA2_/TRDRNA2_194726_c0_seq1:57-809(-)